MASIILASISVPLKWYEAKCATTHQDLRHHEWTALETIGSFWHLGLGAWSAAVMWWYVMPTLPLLEGMLVNVVILLFLVEWLVYHFKVEHPLLAAWFGYTELKHGVGGAATTLLAMMAMG